MDTSHTRENALWEEGLRQKRANVFFGWIPASNINSWVPVVLAVPFNFPVVHSFLSAFVYFLFTPVEVAVFSIAFRELTNWEPAALLSEVT